jgi:hypothetical protein
MPFVVQFKKKSYFCICWLSICVIVILLCQRNIIISKKTKKPKINLEELWGSLVFLIWRQSYKCVNKISQLIVYGASVSCSYDTWPDVLFSWCRTGPIYPSVATNMVTDPNIVLFHIIYTHILVRLYTYSKWMEEWSILCRKSTHKNVEGT